MEYTLVIISVLILFFVMHSYSRNIKEQKIYENKQKEVLNHIASKISSILENEIRELKFEDDYIHSRILISGQLKVRGINKIAQNILNLIRWYEAIILPLFEQYQYEPKYSILDENEIKKIRKICNESFKVE
jgi:cell division ATPase FtsA